MIIEKNILLVEDNPDDEALALRAFKKHNLANRIVVARDGAAALDYLFDCGSDRLSCQMPAVVLLDLKLPKVDGLEVLARLRRDKRTNLLPIVVLSSSREECDLMESYRLGANSYIRKPVDFNQFVAVIEQLGEYWLKLNERAPHSGIIR